MGSLIGPVGALEGLKCAASLSVQGVADDVLSVRPALDGTEYAQVSAVRPNRVWSLSAVSKPEGMHLHAQLREYMRGMRRPLVFYPEDAQVENMLDPESSLMDPSRWSSNMLPGMGARVQPWGADGPRFYRSGATPDPAQGGTTASRTVWLQGIPVPHDRDVSVSVVVTAYTGTPAVVTVNELGIDGAVIGTQTVQARGVLERAAITLHTSPQTVAVSLAVRDAVTIVAPAVTLTPEPLPWVEGQGCMNAVLVGPASKDVYRAHYTTTGWGRRSTYGWTVREIGRGGMSHAW